MAWADEESHLGIRRAAMRKRTSARMDDMEKIIALLERRQSAETPSEILHIEYQILCFFDLMLERPL